MGLLMPIGAVLIALGLAGSATACYQSDLFGEDRDRVTQPADQTEALATERDNDQSAAPMVLAPIAGFMLAAGLVCVGIGIGNWKRPIPSDVRPANPWSDQPGERGDPPKGLV